jgi:hypothetical protein
MNLEYKFLKNVNADRRKFCDIALSKIILDMSSNCPGASTPCKAWSKCSMKKIGGRLLAEIGGKILLAHQTLDFSDRNALKLAYKQA